MTKQESERLIVKYITNQANLEEIELLTQWLKDDYHHQTLFKEFVKVNHAIDNVMNSFDSEEAKKLLLQKIKPQKSKAIKFNFQSYLKYAAILLLCLSGFYFYQRNNDVPTQNTSLLIPKEEAITLQMDNGTVHIINPKDTTNLTNTNGEIIGKQYKSKLRYADEALADDLQYNTLKIPYGKKFEVELSDGTIVHLNSGSALKYPVKFIAGATRHVFLTGEAYFEVTKNKKMPFVVSANKMDVKVLGTHFNISAYQDEEAITTTLVEGKVAVEVNDLKTILIPSQQLSYTIANQETTLKNVNTKNVVSWKNGVFMFDDVSLLHATKQMSRSYNIPIVIQNKNIENFKLSGSISRNQKLEDILMALKNLNNISYEIKNNTVYLK